MTSNVDHPPHYGGKDNPFEAWELSFNLGNVAKYICRAGHKRGSDQLEDLKKAAWYLQRQIGQIEGTND